MDNTLNMAGIVLCGGQSRRMGRPKADLPFGSETLLQRVVRILREVVEQVVVVHAADQVLPTLDQDVVTVADPIPFGGPMIGLRTGLAALASLASPPSCAYLTSCDAPFLRPVFVGEILAHLGNHDVAVPFDERHYYPLAAVYRTCLLPLIADMIDQGQRRPRALFERCQTVRIATTSLTHVDPQLRSLVNLNTPQDYQLALEMMDLPLPDWLHHP